MPAPPSTRGTSESRSVVSTATHGTTPAARPVRTGRAHGHDLLVEERQHGEIGGRRQLGEADLGPAVEDEAGHVVGVAQMDRHVGVGDPEGADHGGHRVDHEGGQRDDVDPPALHAPHGLDGSPDRGHAPQRLAGRHQERLPGGGQADPSPQPEEQRGPELLLQPPHGVRDRRLRDVAVAVAAVLALPGTLVHWQLGHIDWAVVGTFGATSIPFSYLGA